MARSRNLKHGFFLDDELAEHEPLARLFFQALWCLVDYKGNIEWRPKKIKAQTLPYDDCDIEQFAINLDKSGFIRFYSDGEKTYINIRSFLDHQNPHKNERDKGSATPEYSEKFRQALDFKGITINRDKSRSNQDENETDPADSCFLIPDSCSLIPDNPDSEKTHSESDQIVIDYDVLFDKFWQCGIKKSDKKKTEPIFLRLAKKQSDPEIFTSMICDDVLKRISLGQFGFDALSPMRYLRDERWKDDYPSVKTQARCDSSRTRDASVQSQLSDRSWADSTASVPDDRSWGIDTATQQNLASGQTLITIEQDTMQ